MNVYKRKKQGKPQGNYYFRFRYKGKEYKASTDTTNKPEAQSRAGDAFKEAEKAWKEGRRNKELGIQAISGPIPTLKEFVELPTKDSEGGLWWSKFATAYYASKARNTRLFYQDRIKAILRPEYHLADAPLDKIDEEMLDDFVNDLQGDEFKGATVNRNIGVMHLVLVKAKRWKLIASLPEFPPDLPEDECGVELTSEQEKIYLARMTGDHYLFALICLDTGMEPGEAARLQWSDIDLKSLGRFEHGFIHDRCRKTRTRERDLALTQRLRVELMQHERKQKHLFKGLSYSAFQSFHQRLWEGPNPVALPKFRLYDFRHTNLTRFYDACQDIVALKNHAGWASVRMADRYVHRNDKRRAEAARRFDAYIEAEQKRIASD